ncbi:hypothetical protein A2642_02430 [Candidatus Nomurabacteria bacterium RIFCSPHIGHO2_01_FULL_39_10]|uniref:Methyltransferase type 11 domain-containing protein n=1 Tax=Candidatus Nomurabacteria bacterium RIFCSPHIGHO2_01_FULL_39_10 TaxID=1801733 RepID=A0A1F6V5I8_9BACT|nr:MAG: hypothetical protein A2642_02430 [Candidatus Nomurabacteria bacterium RIFCSPHIGHO2_01_FULL_39_10]
MINYTSFTQQQLIKLAKQKTREVFSPEEQHLRSYTFENPPHKRKYIHFSALHYFESAIITPDMITSLQNNATLLSVGSGEGHLERLLKDGFHIPTKNITTSDLYEDPKIEHAKFPHYTFDMTKPWPNFNQQFDYILFPESFGVALIDWENIGNPTNQSRTHRFFNELDKTEKEILAGNLNPQHLNFFMQVVGMDVSRVHRIYQVLQQAIPHLKPHGEIRIKHGIDEPQQRAYIMAKLAQEYQNISFPTQSGSYENFVVKL